MLGRHPTPTSRPVAKPSALRSVAHRFAGACGKSIADVSVLGVRYDDDEPTVGDTLVVRLRPGRLDALAAVSGPARAIACCGDDVVVVDQRCVLRTLDGRLVLEDVIDVFEDSEGASRSSSPQSRLLALRDNGDVVDVVTGSCLLRAPGARSIRGGVVCGADRVTALDGRTLHEGAVDVACAAGGRLAWSRGRNLVVDGRSFVLAQPAQALRFAFGALLVGSQVSGLAVVDDDGLRSLRPSLRAHGLTVVNDGLIVVSDLMVATSDDGIDFVSRDLAAYVRLAEKQSDKRSHAAP